MELLVRIAMDKYYRTGIMKTALTAISKFFNDDGVLEWLRQFESA